MRVGLSSGLGRRPPGAVQVRVRRLAEVHDGLLLVPPGEAAQDAEGLDGTRYRVDVLDSGHAPRPVLPAGGFSRSQRANESSLIE